MDTLGTRNVDYCTYFRNLTGQTPIAFQERLAGLILEGKSVILRAPTGAGKTWATVAPFLYAHSTNKPFADRLLYALPLRSLASSIHQSVSAKVIQTCPLLSTKIQMGGQSEAPFFQADLTFTTIDQLLSGYLMLPVSLSDRVANIPPGALIGSYIVFDELHLLDPEASLGTAIEMLHRLKGLCRFVLMSATLSDESVRWLCRKLGAEALTMPAEEVRALPSQSSKRCSWARIDQPLDAEAILAAHHGGRTIAIFNSVRRSQDAFADLQTALGQSATSLLLLHSRFFPDDRRATETQLDSFFGPNASQSNVILVSTQVVEAGLDISADTLLTELAPVNALVQRAGRSARYQERPVGEVRVYDAPNDLPYCKKLNQATRELFATSLSTQPRLVDAVEEQAWVEQVHLAEERRQLAAYNSLADRRSDVHRAMNEGNRGLLGSLVRDIDSLSLIVSSAPNTLDFGGRGKGWPQLLGVPRGSVVTTIRKALDANLSCPWVAQSASFEDDAESRRPELTWTPITKSTDAAAAWLIALHPSAAHYHPQLGLLLNQPGPEQPPRYLASVPLPRYSYRAETWVDHALRVRDQGREILKRHHCGVTALSGLLALPASTIEAFVDLICLLHDTGKLTVDWQRAAWDWQVEKARRTGQPLPYPLGTPLAHTDYDPAVDPKVTFPPHAMEGAFAVKDLLCAGILEKVPENVQTPIYDSLTSAIARHHSPRAKSLSLFALHPAAGDATAALLSAAKTAELAQLQAADRDEFVRYLLAFDADTKPWVWALSMLLHRTLRLADQAATANLTRK